MADSVVLLSGGLDSTICLFRESQQILTDKVHALSFDYGQRNKLELTRACQIVEVARKTYGDDLFTHTVLSIPALSQLGDGALTNHGVDLKKNHKRATDYSSAFVPGRNVLFLATAASFAYKVGAKDIIIGCSRQGYPDSKKPFIDAMAAAITVGLDTEINIVTPMAEKTKLQRLQSVDMIDGCWEAVGYSYSCYEGDDFACGECLACRKRYWGFKEYGMDDPCVYKTAPIKWEYVA